MAEKNIFTSLRRELKILKEVRKVPGCVELLDIDFDDESISLVMPYYPLGDLYTYSKVCVDKQLKEQDA
jgi:serine/threonine protein kinase